MGTNDYEIKVHGDRCTITKYKGPADNVTVPCDIDGYTVTAIGRRAFRGTTVRFVNIPETVYAIEKEAFQDCRKLTEIRIDGELRKVGRRSFFNCIALSSIDLSEMSYRQIPKETFCNCSKLQKVVLSKHLRSVGKKAFSGCVSLSEINLPVDVEVGQMSFFSCHSLEKDGLLIVNRTLYRCSQAKDEIVTLPDEIQAISGFAFAFQRYEKLILPPSLKVIMEDAFHGCVIRQELIVPDTVSSIAPAAFRYSRIQKIRLPRNLRVIEKNMFFGCETEEVILPDNAELIEEAAFKYASIKEIHLPDSIWDIGYEAFYGCKKLECLCLSDNTSMIGEGVVEHLPELKTLIVGRGCKFVSGVWHNPSLKEVLIMNGDTELMPDALLDCPNAVVYTPGYGRAFPDCIDEDFEVEPLPDDELMNLCYLRTGCKDNTPKQFTDLTRMTSTLIIPKMKDYE